MVGVLGEGTNPRRSGIGEKDVSTGMQKVFCWNQSLRQEFHSYD